MDVNLKLLKYILYKRAHFHIFLTDFEMDSVKFNCKRKSLSDAL